MRNKEIGSEFWHGSTKTNGRGIFELYPRDFDTRIVLSGRTALEIIVKDAIKNYGIKSAYLPSYCCHTMIEPFERHGVELKFYPVVFTDNGISASYDNDNGCELIYLIDYFGFLNKATEKFGQQQNEQGKIVVYDATHSLFCKNMNYSYCRYVFGSFRKWFGVNSAFCSKQTSWEAFPKLKENTVYTDMRNSAFNLKYDYIVNLEANKDEFLKTFSDAEEMLETDYSEYGADELSKKLLGAVDCDSIFEQRRDNVEYLMEGLSENESICLPYKKLGADECPLFLPVRIKQDKRATLRTHFIKNSIYLPVHWPVSDLHKKYGLVSEIYLEELSVVCDQRYSIEDMKKTVSVENEFYG